VKGYSLPDCPGQLQVKDWARSAFAWRLNNCFIKFTLIKQNHSLRALSNGRGEWKMQNQKMDSAAGILQA
jgi:hypothetical protein